VLYQPRRCGERDLYLRAGPEGPSAPTATMASITLNVQCQPGDRNIEGQLIGPNGKPISMNNNNCSSSLAGASSTNDVIAGFLPFALIIGIIAIRRRLRKQ